MNMILFHEADLRGNGKAVISGRRLEQLSEIIKAEPGKFCKAGLFGGKTGSAELLRIDKQEAEFVLHLEDEPPPPLAVTLVAALPRPLTLNKVIHGAVTAGVKRICFIHSSKVEKSYWQSSKLAEEELQKAVVLALEQCCDTIPPVIEFHQRFKVFVEDVFPGIAGGSLTLIGAPAAVEPPPVGAALKQPVTLVVGPEGGFTAYEEQRFAAAGAEPVTLGRRILRTEFAVASLLAILGVGPGN